MGPCGCDRNRRPPGRTAHCVSDPVSNNDINSSFWWFHLLRWLLGGNPYAQLLGSNQRLNGHHTARGGVSNIEPLTRVQEETRV